ncbi:MAG: LysR family transcriptional regulator [Pseudomonadota bacterium]
MNEIERTQVDGELLRSFLVIAEVGSLTVAAARLHRTQSAVSVRLARLEAALGVTLFIRAPSGMRLTAAGERFVPAATAALGALHTAATLFTEPLRGTIHVGLPDDYEDAVFERALARFTQTHPEVAVRATSGCTSSYRSAVSRGDMEVAVVSGLSPSDGVPLGATETVWAAQANLSLDASSPVPLAVMDRSCWWCELPERALREAERSYEVVLRASSFGSLRAAVRAGIVVAALPASSVEADMSLLGSAEGLPSLPSAHRSIIFGDHTPAALATAMTEALRQQCTM